MAFNRWMRNDRNCTPIGIDGLGPAKDEYRENASQLLIALALLSQAHAQDVKRNIPYADPPQERQVLDVYSPSDAKNLPVVFWIHGGGWQTGDKTSVQIKPKAFVDKGFVFVSTNYRLLPNVDMATIVRDIAKSIRWVHGHIADVWRRSEASFHHGPFRRCAARRARLHR